MSIYLPDIIRGRLTKYGAENKDRDTLLPGAFDSIINNMPETLGVLFEHLPDLVAGEVKRLYNEDGFLWHETLLFDYPVGRDMKRLIDVGFLDSFSLHYIFNPITYPKQQFGGRKIAVVDNIVEISIVIMPGDPFAIIEGAKGQTEWSIEDLSNRMEKIFSVRNKLETDLIREICMDRWQKVYEGYVKRLRAGQGLALHYNNNSILL